MAILEISKFWSNSLRTRFWKFWYQKMWNFIAYLLYLFPIFGSQEIGSGLISFQMLFAALWSELIRSKFHSLSSKILEIPEFNLVIGEVNWEANTDLENFSFWSISRSIIFESFWSTMLSETSSLNFRKGKILDWSRHSFNFIVVTKIDDVTNRNDVIFLWFCRRILAQFCNKPTLTSSYFEFW